MFYKKLFAVAGNPILHSKSPGIFRNGFKRLNDDSAYFRISVDSGRHVINLAKEIELSGFNITSPFKQQLINHLDTIDITAGTIGSVNTVVFDNGKSKGYNTDYIGVIKSFQSENIDLYNKNLLVIGAGGAASAAVYVASLSKANITIVNRTEEKAKKLAKKYECKYKPMNQINKVVKSSDIIISCIPVDYCIFDPVNLKKEQVILDANYKNSKLIEEAMRAGCKIINGLNWLIHQALPCFEIFLGEKISEKEIEKDLSLKENIQKSKNISLIGYMGAGKSSIGKKLARELNFNFIDTDNLIEDFTGEKIVDIFRNKGEIYFRKVESQILEKVFKTNNNIISTGGGIILNKKNRVLLKEQSIVIWLWSSVKKIFERTNGIQKRPLLKTKDEDKAFKLLKNRIPLYADASDILFENEKYSIKEIVKRIYNEVSEKI